MRSENCRRARPPLPWAQTAGHAAATTVIDRWHRGWPTCRFGQVSCSPLLVGVGTVDSCGTHLVEVLAVPRDGVGEVDDVEDLGAAEAGDLHGSHAARLGVVTTSVVDGASD